MSWKKKIRRASLRHSLVIVLMPILGTVTAAELWMTDRDAIDAANAAYDRSLHGAVKSIAGNISTHSGGLAVELPYRMFEYFELTASGPVYFRVATSDGLVELGSADLPPSPEPLVVGVPAFYDAVYFGESVRLGALVAPLSQRVSQSPSETVLIQVAESTQSRQEFTRSFILRSAFRDGLIFVGTLVAVLVAVSFAVRPLTAAADQVRARHADDLTPVDDDSLSADVQPFVQAVNQQILRTQQLMSRRRQFLDDATHQLRTHLTVLHVQVDHALGETEFLPLRRTVEALRVEIGHAAHATNQFLALARSDTVTLDWAEFDLGQLVKEVAIGIMAKARDKGIDLGVNTFGPEPQTVMAFGDAGLLREALLNLALNAVSYTPAGGEITLQFATEPHSWVVGVIDNGPGIDLSKRESVGHRFMRVRDRSKTGSGLGIAIANSVAQRHGGGLVVDQRSDGGRGLHAQIWWPRRDRAA